MLREDMGKTALSVTVQGETMLGNEEVAAMISPLPTPGPEPAAEDTGAVIVVELANGGRMRISASTPPALATAALKAMR